MEVPLPFYAAPVDKTQGTLKLVFFHVWSHLVMPPIHSAQITAAYLAFSGMHQAPALCFNSREHLQGTSYFLLNGQLLFLRGLSGERAKNRVLLRRRQVQKKKKSGSRNPRSHRSSVSVVPCECFLVPPGPGRLVLTSLPLGPQEALAASTELPASFVSP